MERPIIAISHERDEHLNFVERHLESPLVVIDPTHTVHKENNELSFEYTGGNARLFYKGEDVSDAVSVWYRKPRPIERDQLHIGEKYKDYTMSALQKHIAQLSAQLPEAQWVSDPYAIKRANNKTLQYQAAYDLGMNVPDTLMTSNGARAKEFLDRYPVSIVKTLASSYTTNDQEEPMAFFARKVHRGEHINLSELRYAPAVFQEAIDAEVDIRVTVVGEQAFAATIIASDISNEAVRDWRAGHFEGNLSIEACNDLPQYILDACIAHVRELDLRYGAIDLVVDKGGKVWFLENNPNGQWGFVEEYTGQPIGAALANMLRQGTG